jgi:DNA mismatch repair protein MutS2
MRDSLNSLQKLEFDKVRKYIQRYTVSAPGIERLENLIPSSDVEVVRASLALVSQMKAVIEEEGAIPLDQVHDLRTTLHRSSIENYSLSSGELLHVAQLLQTSRNILQFFNRKKERYPLLLQKVEGLYVNKILEFNISRAVDENGQVKSSASKELASIRQQLASRSDLLRSRLEKIMKGVADKDWIQDDIITTRDSRMVIPVKTEFKHRVPGFIHSSSASGATVFIEPTETLELNNEIRTLQFAEQREIERILHGLSVQVAEARTELIGTIEILGDVDFVQSKAKFSIEIIGIEPAISAHGPIKLVQARHPLLMLRNKRESVVPLDIEAGGAIRTVLITGPNAGGKSVALKTVGLLNLMALSGLHIPAGESSSLMCFAKIFVEMGDDQSIENDLSSFSSHLTNLRQILEEADESTLVLIDEIASGTDPVEGAALAAPVLEYLTKKGATTIATTHHGALKAFAFETPGITNAAMEFDQESLRPTYRLHLGYPGNSYAIEMAERLNLPLAVVARAKEYRGTDQNRLEKLIVELEEKSQSLGIQLERTSTEKIRLESLTKSYADKIRTLEKELKTIKAKAIVEAEEIISRSKGLVERTIKEIREQSAEPTAVRKVREELKSVHEELALNRKAGEQEEGENEASGPIKIGSHVKIRKSQTPGVVVEQQDQEHVVVLAGNLRILARPGDLELVAQKHSDIKRLTVIEEPSSIERKVDLRGMYGDEALDALDKFLDSAILAGLNRVEVIHGKGTGALRKRVSEYLKSNKHVKTYRLGEWNEGGAGATIVELYS